MYAKLGYGWGNSLLGFLAMGIGVPFPILIYRVLLRFHHFSHSSMVPGSDSMVMAE